MTAVFLSRPRRLVAHAAGGIGDAAAAGAVEQREAAGIGLGENRPMPDVLVLLDPQQHGAVPPPGDCGEPLQHLSGAQALMPIDRPLDAELEPELVVQGADGHFKEPSDGLSGDAVQHKAGEIGLTVELGDQEAVELGPGAVIMRIVANGQAQGIDDRIDRAELVEAALSEGLHPPGCL